MSYLGSWKIDDPLVFTCNTHAASTSIATDADAVPSYRVYEDETGTAILTGSMAKLDDANTTGFYSEQIILSAANGFEKGKNYTIYISATVGGVVGTMHDKFQIEAEVDLSAAGVQAVWDALTSALVTAGSIGKLIVDLQGDLITAEDVWTYATRTLTMALADVIEAMAGSALAITIGVTYTREFSGLTIPATWSKIYFSLKERVNAPEADALIRVQKSVATTGDGLQRLQKGEATATDGSLTVDQPGGSITLLLKDEATAQLLQASGVYDVKVLLADGSSELLVNPGLATVSATPSQALT